MKKLLTVLLTALMVVTLGVVNVAAEGEEVVTEVLLEEKVDEVVEVKESKGIDLAVDPKPLESQPTYDGKNHDLLKGGYDPTFPVPLYGYAYALVEKDTEVTEDTIDNIKGWSYEVPEAKDAGDYYVAWVQFGLAFGTTYDFGVICTTIAKREVTITLDDTFSKVYDGEDLTEEELNKLSLDAWSVTEGEFAEGNRWREIPVVSVTKEAGADAGEYELNADITVLRQTRDSSYDVTDNYDITVVPGTFTIEKAKIEIDTEPFTEAIINAETGDAEFLVDNYEELEETLEDVKFVNLDGEEIPYEVITLYPGSTQSRRVARIKLNVEDGVRQVVILDHKNYKGLKGLVVRPGILAVTASDLKFTKGSKKDRTINITVEVKEELTENVFDVPYVTVDGEQIAEDVDFVFTEEGNVKLLGTYLKTLDHGDHTFVLHNVNRFPGVCAESNIHVSHKKADNTVKIVSTGIE